MKCNGFGVGKGIFSYEVMVLGSGDGLFGNVIMGGIWWKVCDCFFLNEIKVFEFFILGVFEGYCCFKVIVVEKEGG